jgi:hypothetical protein
MSRKYLLEELRTISSSPTKQTIKKKFDSLISWCHKNYDKQAKEYYTKVRATDSKLKKIMNLALKELNHDVNPFVIIPYGSLITKTNILKHSDIDIAIEVKKPTKEVLVYCSNMLGALGYKFKKEEEYRWVFYKMVSGNEVEVSIMDILKDPKQKNISSSIRTYTTYIKKLLYGLPEYHKFILLFHSYMSVL